MKRCYVFPISLSILAPLNTAASEPGHWGVDTPTWRDHRGRIAIPGTLIHGRLVEELHNWSADAAGLFDDLLSRLGRKADDGNVPARKAITFGDFVLQGELAARSSPAQTRIALGDTGTVQAGMLQVIETVSHAGARLVFSGFACAFCAEGEQKQIQDALQAALALIPQIGGERSVGFGQVEGVSVSAGVPLATQRDQIEIDAGCRRIDLILNLDRPFLVAEPNPAENLFTGSDVIPGNAIKGVFADTAKAMNVPLGTWFDRAVFSHAFCSNDHRRPRVPSLSLAIVGNQLVDLATLSGAVVLESRADDGSSEFLAPTFKPDWKDEDETRAFPQRGAKSLTEYLGWSSPGCVLRVRTAIDSASRAAAEGQLFGYQCVLHEHPKEDTAVGATVTRDGSWAPHGWHAVIDLSDLPSSELSVATRSLQTVLRHGLVGLGKTKANVTVTRCAASARTPSTNQVKDDQLVYVVLQTPALLTKPGGIGMGADAATLHDAYRATFLALSDGQLELTHYFARQVLRGGEYLHRRFGASGAGDYAPVLITEAGSVFVLRVKNAARSQVILNAWLAGGLPIPTDWGAQYRDWKTNPYLPQNGFGEIRINDPEHQSWSPATLDIGTNEITNLEDSV